MFLVNIFVFIYEFIYEFICDKTKINNTIYNKTSNTICPNFTQIRHTK